MEIIHDLFSRNETLFWFGTANGIAVLALVGLARWRPVTYGGTNAWYKPIKFALATVILAWSLAWYSTYLSADLNLAWSNWLLVVTLGFEVVYIAWKAGQGQASHFNFSTPFHAFMFWLMAAAASLATLVVAWMGWHLDATSGLPAHYLWALRLGFLLFVVFSFQGFLMGARRSHTVGGPDGSRGLPFLNWSRSLGDLRVAHFVGMHALQLLPLMAWYLWDELWMTFLVAALYGCLAIAVLLQALRGRPLINKSSNHAIIETQRHSPTEKAVWGLGPGYRRDLRDRP